MILLSASDEDPGRFLCAYRIVFRGIVRHDLLNVGAN